jgi:hypothetical protein
VIPVYSLLLVCVLPLQVHTRPRVQRASGIPHALMGAEDKCTTRAHRVARRERVSGNVCLAFAVMASAKRRTDFGPVHSNITALRILRRRLRTVFAAGMALTFIDRGADLQKTQSLNY